MPVLDMSIGAPSVENISILGITELNNLVISGAFNNVTSFLCNDLVEINKRFWINANVNFNNTLNFNHLKHVKYYQNGDYNQWSGKFIQFNMPLLEEFDYVLIDIRINTLSFPKLKKVNHWLDEYGYFIQNLNLPVLETCNQFEVFQQPLINADLINPTISIPLLSTCNNFKVENIGLNSNQINAFLHQFLTVQPTSGKNINFYEQNPPTPPTGQGLIDKQTLINNGNTVITN